MKRVAKRFTSAEDAIIRERSSDLSATQIASLLGRKSASVVSRQVGLGLRVPNRVVRAFTSEEDASIRAAAGNISMYDLAAKLGRKPSSIYGRARMLGLDYAPTQRKAKRRQRGGYWWLPLDVNGRRVWKQEHRYVMECVIGRALSQHEHVHHIDFNKTNNDPSNLYLCDSRSHRAIHNRLEKLLSCEIVVRRLVGMGMLAFDATHGEYRLNEGGGQ